MSLRMLKRNKITFYLAQRDFSKEVRYFNEPIEVTANFSMASSYVDILEFGENYVNMFRSNVSSELGSLFHRTDRIYMALPTTFSPLANDADFEVTSATPQLNGKVILYKRLSGASDTEY